MPGRLYADGAGPALGASDLILTGFGAAASITLVVDGNDQGGTITVASAGRNEVQTLTLTGGASGDTFGLTFGGDEGDTLVTIPAGGYADVTAAQIKTTLLSITVWAGKTADIAVVKTGNNYAITFSGTLGATDSGAITVTNPTGAAAGSVAETIKGATLAAGASVAVAFKRLFAHAPFVVVGKYGVADTEKFAVTAASTTGFTAAVNGTPSINTVYGFSYFAVG